KPIDAKVTRFLIQVTGGINTSYHPTTTAFEDIKSSGNLNVIKDRDLKSELTIYYAEIGRILGNISANFMAMDQRIFRQENMFQMGIAEVAKLDNGFDSTLVDMTEFRPKVYSKEMTKQMKDIALLFLTINARNLKHLSDLKLHIEQMKNTLSEKCST
ncbi:MAG: hypothetical protein AB8B73_01925, partial [Ekhidna sp.]